MARWLQRIKNLGNLPPHRRRLLLEACVALLWARLLLCILPFRHITRFFKYSPGRVDALSSAERTRLLRSIRWAVEFAAERLPGATTCFPRAIATQAMCRRRGVSAVLCYGAAVNHSRRLSAHVWVLDGDQGVIGHQISGDYQILARFPE